MSDNHQYLIWSNEHCAWWAPVGLGYTTLTHAAGRYSKSAADKILARANYQPGVINEIAVEAPAQWKCDEQFINAARASIAPVKAVPIDA